MVAHQAPGVDLPAGLGTSFAEGAQEGLPIGVVAEDGFAEISPIHDVVNGSWVCDAQRTGHTRQAACEGPVLIVRSDPLTDVFGGEILTGGSGLGEGAHGENLNPMAKRAKSPIGQILSQPQ